MAEADATGKLPFDLPDVDYERYTNRQLIAIPLVVLILALAVIGAFFALTGAPVRPGLAFTGGTELQVTTGDTTAQIESTFGSAGYDVESVQPIRSQENSFIVTFQSTNTDGIQNAAEGAGYDVNSIQGRSASFGAQSQTQALLGVGIAFGGMAVLVFALFRTFVPSVAVVASAFSDIVIPVALMNLFGMELTLGTVAALLMLIGYSVDSDLLLNNHVLRRSGGFYESTYRAMRTGVTMTLTSIAAMTVMSITAFLFGIPLLPAVGTVLVFGLTADLMNTYMLNVTLLRYYKYEGVAK
ncbi:protein translocase subunit SecF [Haloglomus litoreum]|uniref:protein translocase subunit SecF n=1 Tax=Haloglomus litoreum TaxID=3034026 RepID=UPI0023E8CAF3|nr:protein translocase subunit SecF [Haloglomus sp. DT116]